MKISKYFTLEEMTHTSSGIANIPHDPEIINNLTDLCNYVLDKIREEFGIVNITSGYRNTTVNEWAGGVPSSDHVKGYAADFNVLNIPLYSIFEWIVTSDLQYDQVILEPRWIHISYNNKNRKTKLLAHNSNGKMSYSFYQGAK